ncbi:hypothetical protein TRAPUB_11762 [Trametes pubescens]|uniref:Uncharacterized protein n=1 Tax=Trametes pubescens TaxID=154538 RepID=A0A1M2VW18_TRAPU|nr:hypothetical protein TRAPUB_11762 [Trametes pubescens]
MDMTAQSPSQNQHVFETDRIASMRAWWEEKERKERCLYPPRLPWLGLDWAEIDGE